ncbi:conserved exported hypothetical protein [Candidatus Sulfopaludibacter sp. SbA3]|nr:conserved exported hypothetical protein [Candidatus Sulfopaludibacter sp. SbA3]
MRLAGACFLLALLCWASPPAAPAFRACPFYWLTGMPCPLCGLTRGLCELAKGHFSQAVHFNALSPLGFVMLFSLFLSASWRKGLWTFGVAAFGVYGVCRLVIA